jgi:hypothetical protein
MTETTQTPENAQPQPAPAPKHWAEDRVAELTAKKYALEEENRQLKAKIPVEQKITLTPEELNAVVARQSATLNFNDASNAVFANGTKEYDDFQPTLQSLHGLGNFGADVIKATFEVEKETGVPAHKIIYALGKDSAKAKEILSKSPLAVATALTKFASNMEVPKPKKQSSAPDPISPVADTPSIDGATGGDSKDIAKWMDWRNKNKKTRR